MPILDIVALSAKHQQFVDRIIAGDSATLAYCTVYSCTEAVGAASGSRLLKNVKVAAEIAKRQQKAASKADLTLENHLAALNKLRDQAATAEQFSAAVSAEVSRGKACGLYVEKTETKHSGKVEVQVRFAREGRRVTAS